MERVKDIRYLVTASLMAALTFAATVAIRIPTPTEGYIHLGDGVVLLSGFVLGGSLGGLAAGIGSALADILGGYVTFAPGTFLIKLLTAFVAAAVFAVLKNAKKDIKGKTVIAGLAGETVMVIGYFLYNTLLLTIFAGGEGASALTGALAASAAEIPMNLLQAGAGIVTASLLAPVILKAKDHLVFN